MSILGVCIVTCDRPTHLESCIKSIRKGNYPCEIVVVDNGDEKKKQTFTTVEELNCTYLDGSSGNSPEGQNIGFNYLKGSVDFILKSDDDIEYSMDYTHKLMQRILFDPGICAVGGICYSKHRRELVELRGEKWFCGDKDVSPRFMLWRVRRPPNLVDMRFLHGGFIYRVKNALTLREQTKHIRGEGPFGEYFSPVAYREETEFSLLLKEMTGKRLVLDTSAESFHYYAKGGIRRFGDKSYPMEDQINMLSVFEKLSMVPTILPPFIGVLDE